mmetsp:Transcript_9504/g.16391  ORF Transcript_9504/g.16391 Transcript_9504/m.16391 type:complete len:211 (+) Transcript_9504:273-905(+)|eukprot:CAMPEP_0196667998 /NCGR_PEP_ID=MMETSP1086-20130531/65387_1 /TAXON_ID=77921 /ORGANISM="Cyanoptyche  gloeocystis , Strain SAG4.97" /LENGTH=210 /DNA_ID=CAMNT_0042005377 /DNA_START=263 /DNA_END=895 /DNA_ORIENTATION=-
MWGFVRQPSGLMTDKGLGAVFATNVFGHFLLVEELACLLENAHPGRIIWVSSRTASNSYFSLDDLQHLKGPDAYGNSKFLCEILSDEMNKRLNSRDIYSFTCCPGFVFTQLTENMVWGPFLYSFTYSLSFVFPLFRMTSDAGAAIMHHLTKVDPRTTDTGKKYVWGRGGHVTYTWRPNCSWSESEGVMQRLADLAASFRQSYAALAPPSS